MATNINFISNIKLSLFESVHLSYSSIVLMDHSLPPQSSNSLSLCVSLHHCPRSLFVLQIHFGCLLHVSLLCAHTYSLLLWGCISLSLFGILCSILCSIHLYICISYFVPHLLSHYRLYKKQYNLCVVANMFLYKVLQLL